MFDARHVNLTSGAEISKGNMFWSELLPGEINGNPFQYSHMGNPMDRGAWQATVHGVSRVGHNLATKQLLTVMRCVPALWVD